MNSQSLTFPPDTSVQDREINKAISCYTMTSVERQMALIEATKCDNYDFCNSFGVRDAVNEFCGKYNLSINFLALDGCLSFGIQKN